MNLVILSLIAGLCARPAAALEGLTPSEEKKLQYCETGIADLNPHIAAECLNEKSLIAQLSMADNARALDLLQKADTLKDLSNLLDIHTDMYGLREALSLRLDERSPSAEIGLGPEPEKFLEWAKKHRPEKYEIAGKAVHGWETLNVEEKDWLKSQNFDFSRWEKLPLPYRNEALSGLSYQQAARLLETPENLTEAVFLEMHDKYLSLWGDLDKGTRSRLKSHLEQLKTRLDIETKAGDVFKNSPAGFQKFQAELENIKNLPVSGQLERLDKFFENSADSAEHELAALARSRAGLGQTGTFTGPEKELLAGLLRKALLDEISGTLAGDRVLDFFRQESGVLKLKIGYTPGYATFDPEDGAITFSEEVVGQWMKNNGYTLNDLAGRQEPIRQLGRLLSAAFVHEATHQEQNTWRTARHMENMKTQEEEIEAMSAMALYTIEKMKKDVSFAKMFSEGKVFSGYMGAIAATANDLQKNPRDFRRLIRTDYYPDLPSFESTAAFYVLEHKVSQNFPKGSDMAVIFDKINKTVVDWHADHSRRIEEELKWADETLMKILAKKVPAQTIPPSAPPRP